MIRVLLADDHSVVRDGLRRIIEDNKDMEVMAEARDGREAIQMINRDQPDVAVLDISMPLLDGFDVVEQVRDRYPKMPILILSMHEEEQFVIQAFRLGVMGYLTKQTVSDRLVEAIRKVHSGARYLTDTVAEILTMSMSQANNEKSLIDYLSPRELQILKRLALGHTSNEISDALGVSVNTVGTYRFRILQKLSLRNNVELSRFAIQNKLINP